MKIPLRDKKNKMRRPSIYQIGISEKGIRENLQAAMSENIMSENFPEFSRMLNESTIKEYSQGRRRLNPKE